MRMPDESEPAVGVEGGCLREMGRVPPASGGSGVTEPPYGLVEPRSGGDQSVNGSGKFFGPRTDAKRIARRGGFMGKAWDSAVPGPDVWNAALRTLRPGGYMLAMGG